MNDEESRTVRVLANSRSTAVAVLSGYLFGVLGFYTNFFESILQATAILADVVTLLTAAGLLITGRVAHSWREGGRRRLVAGTVVVATSIAIINYFGLRPPNLARVSTGESCVYDVTAIDGRPVPLGPGGSITQQFQAGAEEINSISVIIGFDGRTADPEKAHPVRLQFRSADGRINVTMDRPDIVDNAFSRFDLPRPVKVGTHENLFIRIVNASDEPIGVYTKRPGQNDIVKAPGAGVTIIGQVNATAEYEQAGYVLSGCVTRPQ